MAKRVNAPYRPGRRSDDWRKIKLREEATLLIAGYTSGQGARARLGALLLATDDLEYAGNCGSGLSDEDIRELLVRLEPLRRETSPLRGAPKLGGVVRSRVTWVEPELACEVEFTEWTRDRRLRAPVFKRLAEEGAVQEPVERPSRELKLTNQDKVFFPRREDHQGRPARVLPLRRATCSCPTCATARSRSCAIRTASRASTSSRSRRPRTRLTGCAR